MGYCVGVCDKWCPEPFKRLTYVSKYVTFTTIADAVAVCSVLSGVRAQYRICALLGESLEADPLGKEIPDLAHNIFLA